MKKVLFLTTFLLLACLPALTSAQEAVGQQVIFNIEPTYDVSQRSEATATLVKISGTAYWYLDNIWWNLLSEAKQEEVRSSLDELTLEFESNIYPNLTRTFGSEWNPGIDKDSRITILIHPMKKGSGGYNDSADEYPKIQIPQSNEREMVYLNSDYLQTTEIKSFLAHELMHLITFNQKNKTYNVSEEIWLNEARAEYAPTFLGYNDIYEGSHLQKRVRDFLNKPFDSLTEWQDTPADYGAVNLFVHYLVDHYGLTPLADSLKMKATGIASLNSILAKYGFKDDFSQIFTNWVVAVTINNCKYSEKYCYFNPNLADFRITPLINYLPFSGNSTLSVTNTTKDWAGNWHKFIGGNGTLQLDFRGDASSKFKIPYLIQDSSGNFSIYNLVLNASYEGRIVVENFGSKNISLIIIPTTQNKTANFSNAEQSHSFFWSASTQEEISLVLPPLTKPLEQMTKTEISARIKEIMALIVKMQALLATLSETPASCQSLDQDLYFGMRNDTRVTCLQEFLISQGSEIYPEALATGNFFTATYNAVVRFQEKYTQDILSPSGLTKGNGYVGARTRAKINELLTAK
jgi:hypothetical protein